MDKTDERVDGKIFGVPISIRGLNVIVFLAFVIAVGYIIWYLSARVTQEHHSIAKVLERQAETMEEQNYILLADEEEIKIIKKRIKMPKSLRDKLDH